MKLSAPGVKLSQYKGSKIKLENIRGPLWHDRSRLFIAKRLPLRIGFLEAANKSEISRAVVQDSQAQLEFCDLPQKHDFPC